LSEGGGDGVAGLASDQRSWVQIPAARFSEAWEIFFGLKMFARMRGFGGFSVRGVFVMRRREANGDFFLLPQSVGGELRRKIVITAD